MQTREDYIKYYQARGKKVEDLPPVYVDYEGKTYLADLIDAYDLRKDIQLPDGTILRVDGWLENYPPYPENLIVVQSDNTTLVKEM